MDESAATTAQTADTTAAPLPATQETAAPTVDIPVAEATTPAETSVATSGEPVIDVVYKTFSDIFGKTDDDIKAALAKAGYDAEEIYAARAKMIKGKIDELKGVFATKTQQ